MDSVYVAVMALAGYGLRVGAAIAAMLRQALFTRLAVSIWSVSTGRPPLVGQQLFDPAVQLRRQPSQHFLEVSPRLVPVELGRLQQAHHHCGPLARQLVADERQSS